MKRHGDQIRLADHRQRGLTMIELLVALGVLGLVLVLVHGFLPDADSFWTVQSWSIAIEVWLYAAMALAWPNSLSRLNPPIISCN